MSEPLTRMFCEMRDALSDILTFTEHNPYCSLEHEREQCSLLSETIHGDDNGAECIEDHGPCDCGFEKAREILKRAAAVDSGHSAPRARGEGRDG